MPVALSRRIDSEFAGKVRTKFVPALEMEFVTGETKVGAANEFSSEGLAEVSWITVAVEETEFTPARLNVVVNAEV